MSHIHLTDDALAESAPTPVAKPSLDPAIRKDFELLQNEVGALGYRLGEYTTVFLPTRERLDLLNGVAPVFFRMLNETLWADMLMHLGRITDPATQGKFENLTILRLPEMVPEADRPAVQKAVDLAAAASEFAREGRNKVYAHRDLIVVRDPLQAGFTLGSVDQMRAAIEACEAALDTFARCYGANRGTYFHDIRIGIAQDMMSTLEAGHRARYEQIAAAMVCSIAPPAPSQSAAAQTGG